MRAADSNNEQGAERLNDREAQWAELMRAAECRRRARPMNAACARSRVALRPLVRRGLFRVGANPAEMEDVVQDILIAVHLKRQTWDDSRPIGPWIAGIARYKLIDALRRRGRRTDLPIEDFIDILPAETEPETPSEREVTPLAGRAAGRPAQGGAGDRDRRRLDCGDGADAQNERRRGAGGAASRTGSFGETPSRRHMKTDDLIRALAADREPAGPAPGYALALAGAIGFVLSVLLFMWLVPLRPNLGEAMRSWPFMLKPVEMGILVVVSAIVVLRLAKPGAPLGRTLVVAAVVPAIMVAAVAVELMQVPRAEWLVKLAGQHWYMCVLNMVLLSLPMLAALLFGLRFGAPTRPALAGAGAGLLSGALAASLYIAHCPDDLPLFVAAWFTLAIAIATGIGALAGSRLLRW